MDVLLPHPESKSDQLISDLALFSSGSKIFDQIRVVGITGMEIARINLQDNIPIVVKGRQLQFKGGRY